MEDGAERLNSRPLQNERLISPKYSPTRTNVQHQTQHSKDTVQQITHPHQQYFSPPQKLLAMDSITSSTTTTPPLNHHLPLCGEVQVISAAGNHIIAVTNPALIMSPTLNDAISLKRETNLESPDLLRKKNNAST